MRHVEDESIRKGPWTEHEDVQLVFYVNTFGDRRWDFIAKVSGLNRTGKSCRLRWVNYLHPGLKRGRMTPHEERLVLEYHSKWGNSSSSSSFCTNDPIVDSMPMTETKERSFYDTGGIEMVPNSRPKNNTTLMKYAKDDSEEHEGIYSMDEIWKDIDLLEIDDGMKPVFDPYSEIMPSHIWDYSSINSFWTTDSGQEEFSTYMAFPATSERLLG
ncbi:Homeodomain-like protein [Cynara cardunculus var. scolymus]|uniref:Homeodomain-like protein n=1 Tax=Cynara cardunculus var. scolymus TaxID=59895 RepID=A0A103Y6W2_CYNCS|nr:Homeodomain-like protein [Cynara cardunculus var. scolymus]